MLDAHQRDRRQVEHLPPLLTDHRRVDQVIAAGTAHRRDVHHDLIGIRARLQPEPLISGLLAWLPSRGPAQRPRRRLDESIRARRLRGVLRVLPQPRLQRRHTSDELIDPRRQLDDHPVTVSQRLIPLNQRLVAFGEQHQQLLHTQSTPTPTKHHQPQQPACGGRRSHGPRKHRDQRPMIKPPRRRPE
jgi:hypothetical protein